MVNQHLKNVRDSYKTADHSDVIFTEILYLIHRETKLSPHQLMLADSLCSDDVNAIQYPKPAQAMLGPFHLGGLDGYPFTGDTGIEAVAHHVPEDGALVIFYGPHIGISKTGPIGNILRIGQEDTGACCGAAAGALANLAEGKIQEGRVEANNFQMNTIEQIFLANKDLILGAKEQIYQATEVMYEAINKRIEQLVLRVTKKHCDRIILAGVVFINGDPDMGSFCDLRKLELIDNQSGTRKSLIPVQPSSTKTAAGS